MNDIPEAKPKNFTATWVAGQQPKEKPAPHAEQPAQQCKWPTCQSEEAQQALAEQIKRELVGEQPAQQEPVAWMHEWGDGEKIPKLHGRDVRHSDRPVTVRPLVYGDTTPQAQPAQQEPVARKGKWVGTVVDSGYGYKVIGFSPDTLASIPAGTRCYTAPQPQPPQRQPLTDADFHNACLSYRHDYGLLPISEKEKLIFEAKEWARAFGITKGGAQ